MKQFKAMMKYEMIDVIRRKSIFIMSVLLPVIFFLVFSSMMKMDNQEEMKFFTRDYMLSMTTFSLTSFALFTFPVEMINDKKLGWAKVLFKTPLNPMIYYACKVVKIIVMYAVSIAIVFLTGFLVKGVTMTPAEWFTSFIGLMFGGLIFLTFGILLSQFNDVQKMSTVSNILYLGLAMLGGLWFPVVTFPEWLKPIAKMTPTYNFKNIAAGQFIGQSPVISIVILLTYGLIFVILSIWIRRRTEVV